MTCEETEGRLADILAGEAEMEPAVEAHLEECAGCRRDFETARAGWKASEDLPAPGPSRLLLEQVRRRIGEPRGGFFRAATAVAAAVLVGLILFQVVPPPRRTVPPTASAEMRSEPVLAAFEPEGGVGSLVARDLEGRPVGELSIARHDVRVEILDGVARTEIEEVFVNHTGRRLEGTFYFPLPPDASISRLAMEIEGKLMEGTVLERERAREVYEGIVRRLQDPALLEWMPGGIFKCRIFPIEAGGEKRIVIGYTQALPCMAGRMKYVYPLASEKAREHALGQVSIDVAVKFAARMKSIRCVSHSIDLAKKDEHEARGRFEARDLRPTNDFVLDLELEGGEEFVLVPHKTDGEDGYFLAAYTPPGETRRSKGRTYAIVLDISASVSKPELEASRQVVEAILDRIGPDFVLLAHNVEVRKFRGDKRGAIGWMGTLETGGGCDLKAALDAAAAEKPDEIVFVGEGVPTMGDEKFELKYDGTIRTVAVGSDAAAPLLAELARKHGGVSFAISPSDHVRSRVREIADGIVSEVVRDVAVEATQEIYDLAPAGKRNLLAGERLVLTGRWRGTAATLSIGGREFKLAFPVKEEKNNHVKRLWAQRKIADLLADESKRAEAIALSVKYQIMTPYTSFLVLESEAAYKQYAIRREVREEERLLGANEKGLEPGPAGKWQGGEEQRRFAANDATVDNLEFADSGAWAAGADVPVTGYLFHIGNRRVRFDESSTRNPDLLFVDDGVNAWGGDTHAHFSTTSGATSRDRVYLGFVARNTEALHRSLAARVTAVSGEPIRVTIDAGSQKGVQPGMLFAILRDGKFVAAVVVREVEPATATAAIWQGLSLGPVRAGDEAALIDHPAAFFASLPENVRNDLASQRTIERVGRLVEMERSLGK
ncbi:MAG: hypothetical protein HYY17_09280 [Planctomycetes bacterium]|nr:hypothetical protein [Planctomycetota bacterium]